MLGRALGWGCNQNVGITSAASLGGTLILVMPSTLGLTYHFQPHMNPPPCPVAHAHGNTRPSIGRSFHQPDASGAESGFGNSTTRPTPGSGRNSFQRQQDQNYHLPLLEFSWSRCWVWKTMDITDGDLCSICLGLLGDHAYIYFATSKSLCICFRLDRSFWHTFAHFSQDMTR